jgi:DNA-binding protein Fis
MQITITVKDKVIKSAIENAIDNNLFEYFDSATIKAAKLPKMATIVKQVMADAKFQKDLTKRLQEAAECVIEDEIYDDVGYEIEIPFLNDLIEQCESVSAEAEQEAEIAREAQEVERMVKALERAGFKISKA